MTIFEKLVMGERHRIELPQGSVGEEGIKAINDYLSRTYPDKYRELRNEMGEFEVWLNRDWPRDWVVGKGAFVGTFPRRVGNWLYKERKIKADSAVISQIGNLFNQHSSKHGQFEFDFVRRFNWRDGAFGDGGSCYWGGNTRARSVLEKNGCYAIRFFEPGGDRGIGRAWIGRLSNNSTIQDENHRITKLPLDEAFTLFNGYGAYETVRIARVLATFLGTSYKPVSLLNDGRSNGLVWLNHYRDGIHGGGRGFLLGQPSHIDKVEHIELGYEVNDSGDDDDEPDEYYAYCDVCGTGLNEGHSHTGVDGNEYCWSHWEDRFFSCDTCGETHRLNQLTEVRDHDGPYCPDCARAIATVCENCHEWVPDDTINFTEAGRQLCTGCLERMPA